MKKQLLSWLVLLLAGVATAFADVPFRNYRANHFFTLPVASDNIVFIGNSITNMHDWAEAFNNPKIINRGISGAVSDEVVNNLEAFISGHPSKVFLMIGTNDLGTSGMNTPEYPYRNFKTIVDRIMKESPETKIYVQSILPVAAGNSRNHQSIIKTNELMKEYCEKVGITYVDLWSQLVTSGTTNLNGNYTYDGLHLTARGYRVWCKAIEEYVGSATVYPENTTDNSNGLGGSPGMRATYFNMLPVEADDILMIGDDLMSSIEWPELLHSAKVKKRGIGWGYPGISAADVLKTIPLTLNKRTNSEGPAKIFLYAGTSELNGSSTPQQVIETYKSILDKIKELAPNTEVYAMALLPNSAAATNTNKYEPFNQLLKELAESREKVTYIDSYTPFLKNGVCNSEYFTGNYIYGTGVAKLAEIIAPYAGENIQPVTEAEARDTLAYHQARQALGSLISKAADAQEGEDAGQYPASAMNTFNAAVEAAYATLAKQGATIEEINSGTTALNSAISALLPSINAPKTSEAGNEYWYTLTSPLRGTRYVASAGAGKGLVGEDASNYAKVWWKFTARTDGTYNIVNRADGSYINPASAGNNAQLKTSAEEPSAGWSLGNSATLGLFIIKSGSVQLNQTQQNLNYAIYNWGGGNETSDTGCQFAITALTGEPDAEPTLPEPLLDVRNVVLDGTKPYKIDEDKAAPVLAAKDAQTVVIDFTANAASSNKQALISSSNSKADNSFFSVATYNNTKFSAVYQTPSTNNDQQFTNEMGTGTARHQIIITSTSENSGELRYYVDGAKKNTYDFSTNSNWKIASLGNTDGVDGLYLGGIVTASETNKYPFAGTIHSVRIYPGALDDTQIALIRYPENIPDPVLTLTNIRLDGTTPYRIDDDLAAPVLGSETVTAAIDFTYGSASEAAAVLAGSSDEDASGAFFGVVTRDGNKFGVQYIGDNDTEGWYTQQNVSFGTRRQMVIAMQPTANEYAYYLDGAFQRNVTGMGAYGYRTFGNVKNVSGLFLGGLVTADNANKYPFTGTIHSIRFYDCALSAVQVAALEYEDLVPTAIRNATETSHPAYRIVGRTIETSDNAAAALYDLTGKRLPSLSVQAAGIYLLQTGGKTCKVLIK